MTPFPRGGFGTGYECVEASALLFSCRFFLHSDTHKMLYVTVIDTSRFVSIILLGMFDSCRVLKHIKLILSILEKMYHFLCMIVRDNQMKKLRNSNAYFVEICIC